MHHRMCKTDTTQNITLYSCSTFVVCTVPSGDTAHIQLCRFQMVQLMQPVYKTVGNDARLEQI